MSESHFCATCRWGYLDQGRVVCGAPVDDAALRGAIRSYDDGGVNPIWAERKYGPLRILAILSGVPGDSEDVPGMEHDNLRPSDGEDCKMWESNNGR